MREDPVELAFVEAANRIKHRWTDEFPMQAHLGHAIVGSWMFHWLAFDLRSPLDLLRDEDPEQIRRSATDFIRAGFGEKCGPTLNDPAPERIPAGMLS